MRTETSLGLRDSLRKTHREERCREVQRDPGEIKDRDSDRERQ